MYFLASSAGIQVLDSQKCFPYLSYNLVIKYPTREKRPKKVSPESRRN